MSLPPSMYCGRAWGSWEIPWEVLRAACWICHHCSACGEGQNCRWQMRSRSAVLAAKAKTKEGIIAGMAVIHISEAEAAGDFAALMARVRAGEEIVIESGSYPVAVI